MRLSKSTETMTDRQRQSDRDRAGSQLLSKTFIFVKRMSAIQVYDCWLWADPLSAIVRLAQGRVNLKTVGIFLHISVNVT